MSYQNYKPSRTCLSYTGPGVLGRAHKDYLKNNINTFMFNHNSSLSNISDSNTIIFETKTKVKNMTTDMYKENNKSHYSLHCINQTIFYD